MTTRLSRGWAACCPRAVVLLVAFAGTPAAVAETLSVSPAGGEYPDIQAAVTAAASGDTVFLTPGSYSGAGNVNIDFQGKTLSVLGSGRDLVIIDCQSTARAFCLDTSQGEGARIQGLTIVNGDARQLSGGTGGAVHLSSGHLALVDVTIRDCVAVSGGGVSSYWSELQAEGVHILNCSASLHGGGIKALGEGGFSMTTSLIAECSAWQGGGVFLGGVTLGAVSASEITGNSSGDRGAGLHISTCDSVVLADVAIVSNHVTGEYWEGGALYANHSKMSIVSSRIFDNSAGKGGACKFELCDAAEVRKSLIWGNSARYASAAMVFVSTPNSRVSECTIAYNACTASYGNDQGALLFASCAFGVAANNIIAYNSGDCGIGEGGWGGIQVSCNNVFGNEVGGYCEDLDDMTGINGNIAVDPMFCDTLDYCLSAVSPCRAENNDCGLTMGALDCTCEPTGLESAQPTQGAGIRLEYSREQVVVFAGEHERHGSWRLEAFDVTGRRAGKVEGFYGGPRFDVGWPSLLANQASGAYFLRFTCKCGATTSKKALIAR